MTRAAPRRCDVSRRDVMGRDAAAYHDTLGHDTLGHDTLGRDTWRAAYQRWSSQPASVRASLVVMDCGS